MFRKNGSKISLMKLTAFVVLLDVVLVVFIFLANGGNAALAREIFLEKAARAFDFSIEKLSDAAGGVDGGIAAAIHGLKIGTDKIGEIEKKIFAEKEIKNFQDDSKLSFSGEADDVKNIVEEEKGLILGESDSKLAGTPYLRHRFCEIM